MIARNEKFRRSTGVFGTPVGRILALLLAVVAAGVCKAQTPGTYRIVPHASRIEVHVFRGGMLAALGDDHLIVIGDFSGSATGNREGSWQVSVRAESASLRVADPGISDSTRQKIQSTMRGPAQLDVKRYPSIELRTRSVRAGQTPHTWRLETALSLHGVTRTVEFPVDWTQDSDRLEVKGKARLRLRDFGIEPIRKGLGTVKVKNEFEVVYNIVLRESRASENRP